MNNDCESENRLSYSRAEYNQLWQFYQQLRKENIQLKSKNYSLEMTLSDLLCGCDTMKAGERYQLLPVRLKTENEQLKKENNELKGACEAALDYLQEIPPLDWERDLIELIIEALG